MARPRKNAVANANVAAPAVTEKVLLDINPYVELLKTKELTVITDTTKLDAEALSLTTSIKDQDKRIADYLWSEVLHTEKYRNPTRLNTFLHGISKRGARVDAMVKFLVVAGNFKTSSPAELAEKNTEGNYVLKRIMVKDADGKDTKETLSQQYLVMRKERTLEEIEKAYKAGLEKDWWAHKAPPSVTPFDLAEAFKRLLQTATKHKVDQKAGDKIDDNLLNALRVAAAAIPDFKYEDAEKKALEIKHAEEAKRLAEEAAKAQVLADADKRASQAANASKKPAVAA